MSLVSQQIFGVNSCDTKCSPTSKHEKRHSTVPLGRTLFSKLLIQAIFRWENHLLYHLFEFVRCECVDP